MWTFQGKGAGPQWDAVSHECPVPWSPTRICIFQISRNAVHVRVSGEGGARVPLPNSLELSVAGTQRYGLRFGDESMRRRPCRGV
jgi:hypothetical protein